MIAAVLFTVFVWWFSTGLILLLVTRLRRGHRALVFATAPAAVAAGAVLLWTGGTPGVPAAYLGFGAAIGLWGWFELAFLTGVLTGPSRASCPPGAHGWRRFGAAWRTVSHHELALLGMLLLLTWSSHGAANPVGFWTFVMLFGARISAKLNVFLGVPNLSEEMLPAPVAHLKTYFAKRRMNLLFPVSVTVLTFAVACWIERAYAAPSGSGAESGFILLATLSLLALIEHWLMVLPVRDAVLWRWSMARPALTKSPIAGLKTPEPAE
ncbi:MAG: putative photosynthetic complex assembly protein PuhE [Pseudomonadota bacterium]